MAGVLPTSRAGSPTSSDTVYGDQESHAWSAMDTVKALHSDDLACLSVNKQKRKGDHGSVGDFLLKTFNGYNIFLITTWWHTICAVFSAEMNALDRVSFILFACVATIIVTVLMVFCVIAHIPWLVRSFEKWSHIKADDLSLVNASHPEMFESLTRAQLDAARESLAESIENSPSTLSHRVFDLDIARFLLQCAALTYERTSAPVQQAVQEAESTRQGNKTAEPSRRSPKHAGKRATELLGETAARRIMSTLRNSSGEAKIASWANGMPPPLEYSTVSELNGTDAAFCGVFYDSASTWIVLAFKGTDPTEFSEWASDFQYIPREAGKRISGFGQVHGGFYDRLFDPSGGGLSPFDTIACAVRVVADELSQAHGGSKINLWVTGHSLGCAMASLAYASLIGEPSVLGCNAVIRDAYLFAAPIVCDTKSVAAFNKRLDASTMSRKTAYVRSLWRVINRDDAVATALPSLGDHIRQASLRNLFAFAHLGVEVRMGSHRAPSFIKGGSFNVGTWVDIRSKLGLHDVNTMNAKGMQKVIRQTQDIPFIGMLAAHATTMYWDAISQLQVGRAYWAYA